MSRIQHEATGLEVDPERGFVFGKRGKRVGYRNKYGYVEVRHQGKCFHAHRLVYEAVHGPVPPGLIVHHGNGLKHDNRIGNLCAITQRENLLKAVEMGQAAPLTYKQQQRALDTYGLVTAFELAEEFGCSETEIHALWLTAWQRWLAAEKTVKRLLREVTRAEGAA